MILFIKDRGDVVATMQSWDLKPEMLSCALIVLAHHLLLFNGQHFGPRYLGFTFPLAWAFDSRRFPGGCGPKV